MKKEMTFDEWVKEYKPIKNPVTGSFLFESGLDVKDYNHLNIWTDMVADGLNFVLSGGHHVNSMGYYVTEIPFEENQWVEAIIGEWNIDDNDDDCITQLRR